MNGLSITYRFKNRSNAKNYHSVSFTNVLSQEHLQDKIKEMKESLSKKWKTNVDNIHSTHLFTTRL